MYEYGYGGLAGAGLVDCTGYGYNPHNPRDCIWQEPLTRRGGVQDYTLPDVLEGLGYNYDQESWFPLVTRTSKNSVIHSVRYSSRVKKNRFIAYTPGGHWLWSGKCWLTTHCGLKTKFDVAHDASVEGQVNCMACMLESDAYRK